MLNLYMSSPRGGSAANGESADYNRPPNPALELQTEGGSNPGEEAGSSIIFSGTTVVGSSTARTVTNGSSAKGSDNSTKMSSTLSESDKREMTKPGSEPWSLSSSFLTQSGIPNSKVFSDPGTNCTARGTNATVSFNLTNSKTDLHSTQSQTHKS